MDQKLKTKWVAALRSGQYTQGRGRLRSFDNYYCCLGVLCDILDSSKWETDKMDDKTYFWAGHRGCLSRHIQIQIGFTDNEETRLISMNDGEQKTFSEIADYIESL